MKKLVLHYAKNLYDLKKNGHQQAILEMRKCIAALRLVDSRQTAITFKKHLQKIIEELE